MKILFISSLYPVQEGHYRAEVITHALHHFTREWARSHEIQVIRPLFINLNPLNMYHFFPDTVKPGHYTLDHISIHALPVYRIPKTEYYFIHKIKDFLACGGFSPDIIVAHFGRSILLGNILSRRLNIPLFSGVHISDILHLSHNSFLKKELVKALNRSQGIACRSPSILNNLSSHFPDLAHKMFPAYSGIDADSVNYDAYNQKKELPWRKGQKLIISTVSSLITRKKVDTLISALFRFEGDWHLHIVGDGPERPHLEKMTHDYGLNEKITFYGYVSPDQAQRIMAQSHLFIMPSENETFGIVYLEAMAQANIVIGGKNTGVDGLIADHREGFFVTPGDSHELCTLLKNIYCHMPIDQLQGLLNRSFSFIQKMTFSSQASQYLNHINTLRSH